MFHFLSFNLSDIEIFFLQNWSNMGGSYYKCILREANIFDKSHQREAEQEAAEPLFVQKKLF